MIDMSLLDDITTLTEACERCYKLAGLVPKQVAAELGIDYKLFVRMFNRNDPRHFPPDLIVPLMKLCKNVFPLEWLAYRMGYALHSVEMTDLLLALKEIVDVRGGSRFMITETGRVERVEGS